MLKLKIEPRRSEPLVAQIQDQLRAKIRTRQIQPGQRLPSMREMVTQCQVSLGIVKQAINTLTTEGYLRAERGSGVFVAERDLERKSIALVLPALGVPHIGQVITGVKTGLDTGSRRMLVQAANFDFREEAEYIENLDSEEISGAIIYPPPVIDFVRVLEKLSARGVPYVLVDTAFAGLDVDSVTTDWRRMGLLAGQYLLDRGHRNLAVVDQSANSESHAELREGLDVSLRAVGLSFATLPRVVTDALDLNASQPWANGERAAVRLMADHPQTTAVIGMNEYLALGALRGVKASGRRVPEDVSIVSISDLPAFVATDPAVTAFAQAHEEMGRRAARRLIQTLRGSSTPGVQTERLEPTVFERGSVAPPRRN